MWFKESFRVLACNPRMSIFQQGILWNLCKFAWDKQGITETDLMELSRTLREPIDSLRYVWADFLSCAEERNGKWMLPEQWEGVEEYTKKKKKAEEMAEARWNKPKTENKGLTDTPSIHAAYTQQCSQDAACNADLDLDLDKTKTTVNKKSKSHSSPNGEARKRNEYVDSFCSLYQQHTGTPYRAGKKDFVQLAKTRKDYDAANWALSLQRFRQGMENYFASELGQHSLADLSLRFGTFYKSPLDRFGKPLTPTGVNNAIRQSTSRHESAEERRHREFLEDIGAITPPIEACGDGRNGSEVEMLAFDGADGTRVYSSVVGIGTS